MGIEEDFMQNSQQPVPSLKAHHHHPTTLGSLGMTLALAFGCMCLTGVLGLTGYFTYQYFEIQRDYAVLSTRYKKVREALNEIAPDLETMREQLVVTRERNQKILGMLGFNEDPAVGGPTRSDVYSQVYHLHENELMGRLRKDLDEIRSGMELTDRVQGSLESYLLERKDLLRVLPSLNPAPNGWYTSGFGMRRDPFSNEWKMHSGLDVACSYRCEIYATADGVVVGAGTNGAYGREVTIDHGFGIITKYAHLSQINVEVNDYVSRGDHIGMMGMSGRATGVHLHYEVLYNGQPVDPRYFIVE